MTGRQIAWFALGVVIMLAALLAGSYAIVMLGGLWMQMLAFVAALLVMLVGWFVSMKGMTEWQEGE